MTNYFWRSSKVPCFFQWWFVQHPFRVAIALSHDEEMLQGWRFYLRCGSTNSFAINTLVTLHHNTIGCPQPRSSHRPLRKNKQKKILGLLYTIKITYQRWLIRSWEAWNAPVISWKDVISVTSANVKEKKGSALKDESKRRRSRSLSAILITVQTAFKEEEVLISAVCNTTLKWHFSSVSSYSLLSTTLIRWKLSSSIYGVELWKTRLLELWKIIHQIEHKGTSHSLFSWSYN